METHAVLIIPSTVNAELLYSDVSLSFWGGVNVLTGEIVDQSHPLHQQSLKDRVLAIPSGRGSCTGSQALLELLLAGCGPAALVFERPDPILSLGVLVASKLFGITIPVVSVGPQYFGRLRQYKDVKIAGHESLLKAPGEEDLCITLGSLKGKSPIKLSDHDRESLDGKHGEARKVAMELLVNFAEMQGAERLIDVSRAHIDACIYIGPAGLAFAQKLLSMNAKYAIPTTLNAISIDQRQLIQLGPKSEAADNASALANAYLDMGAVPSFSCAPYSLASTPQAGDQIGWSESNAVIFANSILGARTQKYPDFLDVCIALTGRAPLMGCHTDEGRRPTMRIQVTGLMDVDDATYPLLGYVAGRLARHQIALICGLEHLQPNTADLKAFCAAFGTTSSAAMFHIAGITPDYIGDFSLPINLPVVQLSGDDVSAAAHALNTAKDSSVQLISLGSPHFLLGEFVQLAQLCRKCSKCATVDFLITTNREIYARAEEQGLLQILHDFGATILTDTCWCMVGEPVVGTNVRNIMTNSAKYAHYAPGLVGKGVHFGNLVACVKAACDGFVADF